MTSLSIYMRPDIAGLHGDVAVSSLMRVEIERPGPGQDTPRPKRLVIVVGADPVLEGCDELVN